jgi:hypothetical protein
MKKVITLIFVCINLIVTAQNNEKQFPEDFFGTYKGDLEIISTQGKQTIQMEFHLKPTDSIGKYDYIIVYIMNGNRQERNYSLLEIDKTKGLYTIDENNGILIDAKCMGATLFSMFEVQGNILTTTERFYDDAMDFEITSASKQHSNASKTKDENPVDVISYPITVWQKANLVKQKE